MKTNKQAQHSDLQELQIIIKCSKLHKVSMGPVVQRDHEANADKDLKNHDVF